MLNYLDQILYFWRVYDANSLGQAEIALYFHLLDICNNCSWTNPFKRQNTKICAHLGMSKKTLEKTRNRLQQVDLIRISGTGKGSNNISYELKKAIKYSSKDSLVYSSSDTSDGNININIKKDLKVVVIEYAQAIDFFLKTQNCRTLAERFFAGARDKIEEHFKIFYDDKVDLGEFNNKTKEDMVKHFSNWLPIYLRVLTDQERALKKDQSSGIPESQTDAALRRHHELLKNFNGDGI